MLLFQSKVSWRIWWCCCQRSAEANGDGVTARGLLKRLVSSLCMILLHPNVVWNGCVVDKQWIVDSDVVAVKVQLKWMVVCIMHVFFLPPPPQQRQSQLRWMVLSPVAPSGQLKLMVVVLQPVVHWCGWCCPVTASVIAAGKSHQKGLCCPLTVSVIVAAKSHQKWMVLFTNSFRYCCIRKLSEMDDVVP